MQERTERALCERPHSSTYLMNVDNWIKSSKFKLGIATKPKPNSDINF